VAGSRNKNLLGGTKSVQGIGQCRLDRVRDPTGRSAASAGFRVGDPPEYGRGRMNPPDSQPSVDPPRFWPAERLARRRIFREAPGFRGIPPVRFRVAVAALDRQVSRDEPIQELPDQGHRTSHG
jgi:hypothetical protein